MRLLRLSTYLSLSLLALVLIIYRLQSEPITPDWSTPVELHIYPVNADQRLETAEYLASLTHDSFADIEAFFAKSASVYNVSLVHPIRVRLMPVVDQLPPRVPVEPSIVQSMFWGLRMRLWVSANDQFDVDENTIRVFMNYYAPSSSGGNQHSLGLQKGRIGLVNGFAGSHLQGVNNVVAVHEALHTLGALDRYDSETAEPLWPDGYADPYKEPLFPQHRAEIMGGRIQIIPGYAVLPPSLSFAHMGDLTAREIGWLNRPRDL